MNRIVHFEIFAADIERAKKFYTDVFGWDFPVWMEDPLYVGVMTAPKDSKEPGINGGLLLRKKGTPKDGEPANAFICTVQVENIEETIKKILSAGGTMQMPKYAIPKMAWQAYYKDTEGNIFGIHQADLNAI